MDCTSPWSALLFARSFSISFLQLRTSRLHPNAPPDPAPQLERTTLPKSERGYKQLGRLPALLHLLQIASIFVLGAALVLLPAPAPRQQRVHLGTFGVMYALQVNAHVKNVSVCLRFRGDGGALR